MIGRQDPKKGRAGPSARLSTLVCCATVVALSLIGLDAGQGRGTTETTLRVVSIRMLPAWDAAGASTQSTDSSGSANSGGLLKLGGLPALSAPGGLLTDDRTGSGSHSPTAGPKRSQPERTSATALKCIRNAFESCSAGESRTVRTGALPPPLPALPTALLRQYAAATATADFRHDLVKAMRGWRRGIRTLVLTNATGQLLAREQQEGLRYNEVWQHYPDVPGFSLTGKPGDPRAAVGPALALAALGANFSWLLYGDDDVAFFWPGLLRALRGLSSSDPYFLTDDYYSRWPTRRVGQHAPNQPRCVPCSLDTEGLDLEATHALQTCNCSVAAMAAAFKGLLGGQDRFKSFPRRPPITTVAGGGGAVLSIGLLRRLNSGLYKSCVHGNETGTGGAATCGGSDGLLTACLWQQGFGYTDPGTELRHRGTFAFNTYRSKREKMEADLRGSKVGSCGSRCRFRLRHAVSLHTHGALMANYSEGAADLARLLCSAAEYAARSALLEQFAQDAGL